MRTLYEQDEHAWIEQQIALMRAGKLDQLDGNNLVLFLSDMMIRDRRELRSRVTYLLVYLLKIQHLSEPLTPRMVNSVIGQQQEINTLLAAVPSLQKHVPGVFESGYRDAVRQASVESDVDPSRFPAESPWNLQELIDMEPFDLIARRHHSERPAKVRTVVPEAALMKVLTGGKVVEVAREYGIPRQTLADRVKRVAQSPAPKPDTDPVDNANGEERSTCDEQGAQVVGRAEDD